MSLAAYYKYAEEYMLQQELIIEKAMCQACVSKGYQAVEFDMLLNKKMQTCDQLEKEKIQDSASMIPT